jgi:hypothetical protein
MPTCRDINSVGVHEAGQFTFGEMGVLPALLATGSGALVVGGSGVLLNSCLGNRNLDVVLPLFSLPSLAYCADGVLQLASVTMNPTFDHTALPWYPSSRTGLFTVAQVICGACFSVLAVIGERPGGVVEATLNAPLHWLNSSRGWAASIAVACRHVAVRQGPCATATALHTLGAILLFFAVTPKRLQQTLDDVVERAANAATAVFSAVYAVVQRILPKIIAAIVAVLQHPLLLGVYTAVIEPAWCTLSPLALPLATAAVSRSCWAAVSSATVSIDLRSAAWWPIVLGYAACGTAAAVSSAILAVHAASKVAGAHRFDPLKSSVAATTLCGFARLIQTPHVLLRSACWQAMHLLWPPVRYAYRVVLEAYARVTDFVLFEAPIVGIPAVLTVNYYVFSAISNGGVVTTTFDAVTAAVGSAIEWVLQRIVSVVQPPQLSGGVAPSRVGIDDATFALVLIATAQVVAYGVVYGSLRAVVALAPLPPAQTNGTPPPPNDTLSAADLNSIAETMRDPRQCAACAFGPVDHRGCANLVTHHGERGVSNRCPRCDWFGSSLNAWPPWDNRAHTAEGLAALRVTAWSDVVVVIRAASKALVIPCVVSQSFSFVNSSTSTCAPHASRVRPQTHLNQRVVRAHELPLAQPLRAGGSVKHYVSSSFEALFVYLLSALSHSPP